MRPLWAVPFLLAACAAPSDYYGLDVGLGRTYRTATPPGSFETRVVRELSMEGGRAVLVERLRDGAVEMAEAYGETEAGFGYCELLQSNPRDAKAEDLLIEVGKPVQAGTSWKVGDVECRVEAIEDVSVGAGRFAGCARVRFGAAPEGKLFWFAPGVGLVKGDGVELVRFSRGR